MYTLLDDAGEVVANGHKQAFCLIDWNSWAWPQDSDNQYTCSNQGIQMGWQDVYGGNLDCNWIDITDVPPGDYVLRVHFNPDALLEDDDLTNNEAFVGVTIDEPESAAPEVQRVWRPGPFASYDVGRTMFIQWSSSDDEGVVSQEVWFSPDDGASWERLVGDLEGDATWYAWTIPADAVASRGRIRVVARDGEAQRAERVSRPFRVRRASRIGVSRRLPVRLR